MLRTQRMRGVKSTSRAPPRMAKIAANIRASELRQGDDLPVAGEA